MSEQEKHSSLSTSPFDAPGIKAPLNDEWAAKRELAQAVRELTATLMATTAEPAALREAAQQVQQANELLSRAPKLTGRTPFEERAGATPMQMGSLGYELNPLDGQSNPIASSFDIWFDGDRIHGRVTMGWQYEGPPNSVHGGLVAALFDQFLGVGQKLTDQPGFTGTLKVRYIKPTPIATELRLEGWVEKVDGRKNFLKGEMWAGDVLTASCEGLFIAANPELMARLKNLQKN